MTTLEPCPHCGNAHNKYQDYGFQHWISCPSCEMLGPDSPSEEEAAAAWNALPRPSDVTALKARAEAAEAERDRLAARVAELEASIQTEHYRAQRELLLCLWREIEGDQDGDAPGNHFLEAGLVAAARARDERTEWLEARVAELEAEAAAYREILEDVRESLELLAPVPAPAPSLGTGQTTTLESSAPPDETQVADSDGWFSHQGQRWPWCFLSERVEVRFRDGTRWSGLAQNVTWGHHSEPKDIVQWRPESAPVGTEGVSMADALGWHRRYYSGAAGYPTGTAKVDYQRRNGMFGRRDAGLLDWTMTGGDDDIVRWRLTPDHAASKGTTP